MAVVRNFPDAAAYDIHRTRGRAVMALRERAMAEGDTTQVYDLSLYLMRVRAAAVRCLMLRAGMAVPGE